MKFIVSNKIRGTIVLPTVGYALKAGQMVSVVGEQTQAIDILIAIKRGFLENIDDDPDITNNISVKEEKEKEEKKLDAEKLDLTKPVKVESKVVDKIDVERKESNMMSYNLETQKILDKDDSRKTAMDRISSVDAEPVQVGPIIDFEDERVEEIKEEKPKPKKKAAKKKAKKRSKKTKSVKQKIEEVVAEVKKTIKPVGEIKEEPKPDDVLIYDNGGEIGFVDEEQTQKRIQNHPILSKKVNENNSA